MVRVLTSPDTLPKVVARLTVHESSDNGFWVRCEMLLPEHNPTQKSLDADPRSGGAWNSGGYVTSAVALNAGTYYAMKRAGILVGVERTE